MSQPSPILAVPSVRIPILVPFSGPADKTSLEALDPNKVEFFTFENYENWVKVWKVLDGDSIHIIILYDNHPIKLRCRLNGIDSADLESKDPEEKAYAKKARDRLNALANDKILWGKCYKFDKYGRLLIELFPTMGTTEVKSINQILLDEKMAYAYAGKTKVPFKQWSKS